MKILNSIEEMIMEKLINNFKEVEDMIRDEICVSENLKSSLIEETIIFLCKINNIKSIENN